MSTSNFYNVNASKIYACDPQEEWDYEDLKSNLKGAIERIGGRLVERQDPTELRNYGSRVLGQIEETVSDSKDDYVITVMLVVRGGYYYGYNLDWVAEFTDNRYGDMDNIKDVMNDKEIYKTTKIKIERAYKRLVKKIEKICEDNSTPLKVTARFSNGETWYAKA
jgi:hypothetical protein